jgi:uncharacterized protein involved in exopolysaccharide biosynthesis
MQTPIEEAVTPLPIPLITPPVTTMYLVGMALGALVAIVDVALRRDENACRLARLRREIKIGQ